MFLLMISTILFSFFLGVNTQNNFESPCPHLFLYEGIRNTPGKWYGIIILLSNEDLNGIWLRLIFDKPFTHLGNWLGEVTAVDSKEYLIKNETFHVKANVPEIVRFYVNYDHLEPAPKLLSFRINSKTVCPEDIANNSITIVSKANLDPTKEGAESDGNIEKRPNFVQNNRPYLFSKNEWFFADDLNPSSQQFKDNINAVCGTIIQPSSNDVGTRLTYEGAFPWHAALYYTRGNNLVYICGGSLISTYHVLTVAHCVALRRSQKPLDPETLVVYLGKHYLKQFLRPGIQDRSVSEIIIHPQYNPQNLDNDIALIKFIVPVRITNHVRPVCLWQDSPDLSSVFNKLGRVVGHGFDTSGTVTEQLVQAKMPVVSKDTCIFSFPGLYDQFTSDSTYCARFKNGTSICSGDSGGGMVFPVFPIQDLTGEGLRWQLRGLVSISVTLQNQFKCDASHYVLFTDSAKYLDWIKKSMKWIY